MLESISLSWKVAIRHWGVYRKHLFSNIVPTVTEPMFFIASFGIGLGAFVSEIKGMSYIEYMAPGLVTSTALFTAFFSTSYNFFVRLTYDGVTHALLTTPVGAKELILGEYIWVGLKSAGMSFGVALVFLAFGVVSVKFIFLVPFFSILVGLACGAVGLLATGFVSSINQFQTVYSLIISPMFFFSGIFFPIDQFPGWMQAAAHFSPLYHGVVINQQLLWERIDLATIAIHILELLVMIVVLGTLSYWKIRPKLIS